MLYFPFFLGKLRISYYYNFLLTNKATWTAQVGPVSFLKCAASIGVSKLDSLLGVQHLFQTQLSDSNCLLSLSLFSVYSVPVEQGQKGV